MVMPSTFTLWLPIVMGGGSPPRFGVQVDGELTIPITPNRIYQSPARWQSVDLWLDANLHAFGSEPFIIGTKTCPLEYRLWPDKQGSPPRPENYQDYANWIYELACKYSPWGIEIWNEPDAPNYIDNELQYWYGAWADGEDFYGGGVRYGELLSTVYPMLHSIGVQVLGGALSGSSPNPRQFLRGMMTTGKCDFVSFHVYLQEDWLFSRVDDVIGRLTQDTDIPLMITETSIISSESSSAQDTDSLRARQAEYCEWLIERSAEPDFPNWLWYCSNNIWRNCGLWRYGASTPAYDVWVQG